MRQGSAADDSGDPEETDTGGEEQHQVAVTEAALPQRLVEVEEHIG